MGNICWIASYPKSGNTWMRAFIANYLANERSPVDLNSLHERSQAEAKAWRFSAYVPGGDTTAWTWRKFAPSGRWCRPTWRVMPMVPFLLKHIISTAPTAVFPCTMPP